MTIKRIQALVITDEAQLELISPDAADGMEDNGGQPDGDTYILPGATDEGDALEAGAYVGTVWQADYSAVAFRDNLIQFSRTGGKGWSGLSASETAYFLDKGDAELCQAAYDLYSEDSCTDTLAHRYNTM